MVVLFAVDLPPVLARFVVERALAVVFFFEEVDFLVPAAEVFLAEDVFFEVARPLVVFFAVGLRAVEIFFFGFDLALVVDFFAELLAAGFLADDVLAFEVLPDVVEAFFAVVGFFFAADLGAVFFFAVAIKFLPCSRKVSS